MTTNPNYYLTLGVSAACDDVVIHAAYKALMLKYHPDINSDSNANYRSACINEAFKVLRDKESRRHYDISINLSNTNRCCCINSNESSNTIIPKPEKLILTRNFKNRFSVSTVLNLSLVIFAIALTINVAVWIAFPELLLSNLSSNATARPSYITKLYDDISSINLFKSNLEKRNHISNVDAVKIHTGKSQIYSGPLSSTEHFSFRL